MTREGGRYLEIGHVEGWKRPWSVYTQLVVIVCVYQFFFVNLILGMVERLLGIKVVSKK